MKYKMKSTTKNVALRSGSNVGWPRNTKTGLPLMLVDDGNVVRNIEMQGEEMIVLLTEVQQGTTVIGKAGDKWLHVLSIGGLAANGYVAYIHMGVVQCDLTASDDPTPPTDPPAIPDDIIVNVNRSEGITTVNVDGDDYKPEP